MKPGSVFSVADFTDIAQPKTVSKMLTRLSEDGVIGRVLRSVFWLPDGENEHPKPDAVAKALARENKWSLAPSGETALFIMGVEPDEPDEWTYVTNGTYRSYNYGSTIIRFTHASFKFLGVMSEKTRLLVQCIRAYGQNHFSEEKMAALWNKCKNWDWKRIFEEAVDASAWIVRALRKMVGMRYRENTVKG